LNLAAAACNVPQRLSLDLLEGEELQQSRTEAPQAWQDLLLGKIESVRLGPDAGPPMLILAGAFDPMHAGHQGMARIAREIAHQPVAFEISILNVDKPPLDYMEIERRLKQFPAEQAVYLTRAATFVEKSRLFPGAAFIVGADTIRRIAAPRYYGDRDCPDFRGHRPGTAAQQWSAMVDENGAVLFAATLACEKAIKNIAGQGCRFLVFGRELSGSFIRLGDLDLPDALRSLCSEVPPEVFREDVSSTALRKSGAW
jgi:hypothetical protein